MLLKAGGALYFFRSSLQTGRPGGVTDAFSGLAATSLASGKKTHQRALLSHASDTDLSPPATPFARNWKADYHLEIVGRPIGRS
jgi:hypothetical protein